jgi:transcription antitermination factor NusA-like protein
MELGKLNEEIEKIDIVKYHRVFVPNKQQTEDVSENLHVETADIYIKDEIPLEHAIGELAKTCILDYCYATITTHEDQKVYVTNRRGHKVIRYLGQLYRNLSDLVSQTDIPIDGQAVNKINLSFNEGSFDMLFG